MGKTIIQKILSSHLVDGDLAPGAEIGVRVDQTLTQDATGTMAMMFFEAIGVPRVRRGLSVSYIDHNMAGFGPANHNDQVYLQTAAAKFGIYHSKAGGGICHQVHLECFARPGGILIGSDSHTPTCGGVGMLAMGAGGLDVAVAMAGGTFYLKTPRVLGVRLSGRLADWVAAKDVVLKLLGLLTTKGNVGWAIEYLGEGVGSLSVTQRVTIANMGAELGVTTSIFASDEQTRRFLAAEGRESDFIPLGPDEDAQYDRVVGIDLASVEPMAACPASPDNVRLVAEVAGARVGQVIVGSCVNSSFADLMTVARLLKDRHVNDMVEFAVAPGSRQVLQLLVRNGALSDMISAGARILEPACGPCIGQGLSPASGMVSLRTFNRNFAGRSGTASDQVYLVSCETAVASALTGCITDPRSLGSTLGLEYPRIELPSRLSNGSSMVVEPLAPAKAAGVEIVRPSTVVAPPQPQPLPDGLAGKVVIKCGDKITTDHIVPAGAFLRLRSNIPEYAKSVFNCFNKEGAPTFAERSLRLKQKGLAAIIVAGEGYGQGSSREHAALCPMYLGVRMVIAKSIERIHKANLVNFCIVPLELADWGDYDRLNAWDLLGVEDLPIVVASAQTIEVVNRTGGFRFAVRLDLSDRERKILLSAGLLNYARSQIDG